MPSSRVAAAIRTGLNCADRPKSPTANTNPSEKPPRLHSCTTNLRKLKLANGSIVQHTEAHHRWHCTPDKPIALVALGVQVSTTLPVDLSPLIAPHPRGNARRRTLQGCLGMSAIPPTWWESHTDDSRLGSLAHTCNARAHSQRITKRSTEYSHAYMQRRAHISSDVPLS